MRMARHDWISLLAGVVLWLWSLGGYAQGLLVAWQGEPDFLSAQVSSADAAYFWPEWTRLSAAGYTLAFYRIEDRHERLRQLQALRADTRVIFAELDAAVETQHFSPPAHFPLLGQPNAVQLPCLGPIAIIDSGIDTTHTALQQIHFPATRRLVADLAPDQDATGHGTHIAGLIAARPFTRSTPSASAAGVCAPPLALLSYRFLGQQDQGSLAAAIEGIYFAIEDGARLLNASWITRHYSRSLEDAIRAAVDAQMLVIAAAGNDGVSLESQAAFPAAFSQNVSGVISVANLANTTQLHPSSNWGAYYVDLAAPGTLLLSTVPSHRSDFYTGTSMAAPLVTSALAVLWARFPDQDARAIKAALFNSLTPMLSLQGQVRHAGRVNLQALSESSAEELFRPAWFSSFWNHEGRLIIDGYQLGQISQIRWQDTVRDMALPFSYQQERLSVDLPPFAHEGRLILSTATTDELAPLFLRDPASLVHHTPCDGQTCQLIWQEQPLRIERQDGATALWWGNVAKDGRFMTLRGERLSAEWHFSLGASLAERGLDGLEVQHPASGAWVRLSRQDGLEVIDGSRLRWVLADASPWLQPGNTWQTLHLRPVLSQRLSGGGGCYIATLVYGDAEAEQVQQLRAFRDQQLMHSATGRWLVHQYYRWSPGLVEKLAPYPRLQSIVRFLLDLLVDWLRR